MMYIPRSAIPFAIAGFSAAELEVDEAPVSVAGRTFFRTIVTHRLSGKRAIASSLHRYDGRRLHRGLDELRARLMN